MLFDVTKTEVKNDYQALPEGDYLVVSDTAVVKETKDGTGKFLAVTYKVLDGPYQGRLFFHNFNFANKSEKAVEIAMQELKKWFRACGLPDDKMAIKSADSVLGLSCIVKLGVKTDDYGDKNYPKAWKSEDKSEPIDRALADKKPARAQSKSVPGF